MRVEKNTKGRAVWENLTEYFYAPTLTIQLLTTDKRVSDENSKAIEYFKSEGGLFTFATGRVPARRQS